MTSHITLRLIPLAALLGLRLTTAGQGVVTNVPPLPTLTDSEKQQLNTPDTNAIQRLQTMWSARQTKYASLTNGSIDALIAELGKPTPGTTILWQHMPEVGTNEVNTFRKGWLVWWPPRFDVDYGILMKEPEAAIERALKASLFESLLRRDESRALDYISGICTNNPPTLQHASYARAILEYQPRTNLFTEATAKFWKSLLNSGNPLFLGMAMQLAPGHVIQSDLDVALRRAANSDWMSLKYLAVEALASLPKGKERDALSHTIDPIRQTTTLPALIADKLKEMEDAQPSARPYGSPAAGSPSGQP
jgi:hypothetical protein